MCFQGMPMRKMDSRLIQFEIEGCNHWLVDLIRVVMVNLSEWQIRAFCVLVKRKKVGLREWCDGRSSLAVY